MTNSGRPGPPGKQDFLARRVLVSNFPRQWPYLRASENPEAQTPNQTQAKPLDRRATKGDGETRRPRRCRPPPGGTHRWTVGRCWGGRAALGAAELPHEPRGRTGNTAGLATGLAVSPKGAATSRLARHPYGCQPGSSGSLCPRRDPRGHSPWPHRSQSWKRRTCPADVNRRLSGLGPAASARRGAEGTNRRPCNSRCETQDSLSGPARGAGRRHDRLSGRCMPALSCT